MPELDTGSGERRRIRGSRGQTGLRRELSRPTWQRLGALPVPQDRPPSRQAIRLTREQVFGPANLIASWDRTKQEQRYGATSRPATGATFQWGRHRSWIAGTFREEKSGGFHKEDTHLTEASRLSSTQADRLDRLWLVMVIGSLGCFQVGRWLCNTGQRRLVDAAKRCILRYFRLDLDWLRRAINIGQPLKEVSDSGISQRCLLAFY